MRIGRTAKSTGIACLSIIACLPLVARAAAANASPSNADCLMCHSATTLSKTEDGKELPLYVDPEAFEASSHRAKNCTDCHTDLRREPLMHKPHANPVRCARCHRSPDMMHRDVASHPDVPECSDCHGSHYIRAAKDPSSSVHPANAERVCAGCHSDPKTLDPYAHSVHGAITEGGLRAAACTDCHPAHPLRSAPMPVFCGKCHSEEYKEHVAGSHGAARLSGDAAAPSCVECHGAHSIRRSSDPASQTFPAKIPTLCAKCHDDPRFMRKYRLPTDTLKTYSASYHGIALKYGSTETATCTSCHGAHRVLPSSDPVSSVSKANLPETCGKCHPSIGPNVIKGSVHVQPSPRKDAGVYWVTMAYRVLIALIMLAFCGYIALDLSTYRRTRRGGGR